MYTAGAKKDLRNIFRYISEELLAPENAAGGTERIMYGGRDVHKQLSQTEDVSVN